MFRRRRGLAIALLVTALALSSTPAAATGRGDPAVHWTFGIELRARLGQIGEWLRTVFFSDGTPYIDPNGG